MRVKKFKAKTINEAVAQMKAEFGSDAVVLHTKVVKSGGFLGFFSRKSYEITGAIDPNLSPAPRIPKQPIRTKTITPAPPVTDTNPDVSKDLSEHQEWTSSIQSLYQLLQERDIPRQLALEIIKLVLRSVDKQYWNDLPVLKEQLRTTVKSYFITKEPWEFDGNQKVVVLVGPTGVGKTTTIAKLAANYHLIAEQSVGLITIDTYRIGAVDQLKTYANIIDVPLKVAYSLKELQDAIAGFNDQDLILIDTAGRSHANAMQMAELQAVIKEIKAEVYLVVGASTKNQDINAIIASFSELKIDNLIITKLDETESYGVLLQAPTYAKAPIAFITNGQSVPDDIEVADVDKLTNLVLGD